MFLGNGAVGWFSQDPWAPPKARTVGRGLGRLLPCVGPAAIRIASWAGATLWFSGPPTSPVSCDWHSAVSVGMVHGQTAWQEGAVPFKYQSSTLVLHAASVRSMPWYQYKLCILFATLCWIPTVISHDFWWLRNRTELSPNQVFLMQAKLSWMILPWCSISVVILSTEILPVQNSSAITSL